MMRRAGLHPGALVIGLVLATLLNTGGARAIEVKKQLYGGGAAGGAGGGGGPAPKNPLTPALQRKLMETIQSESDTYVAEESEKKASAEPYVDIDGAPLKYSPQPSGGKMQVTAKLEGAEYKLSSSGTGKGRPTGKRRALVFKYRLEGQNWTEVDKPVWQDVAGKGGKAAN